MTLRLLLLAPFLTFTLAGCRDEAVTPGTASIPPPRTELYEAGEIVAATTIPVNSPPSWGGGQRILRMIPEGTIVSPGDTLLVFDDSRMRTYIDRTAGDLAAQVLKTGSLEASHESNLQSSAGAVAKASLAHEMARLDLHNQRFEALVVQERARLSMAQAVIDLAQARRDSTAQAHLDSLNLAGSRLQEDRLRARMQRYRSFADALVVVSDWPGMVVYHRERTEEGVKVLRVGDEVSGQVHVLDVTDTSVLKVRFTVHELDRWRLAPGQQAQVVLDAYPDLPFAATLEEVQRMPLAAEEGSLTRRFAVLAVLHEPTPEVRPGMSARVAIRIGESREHQ
ncbi:MAG: HlyD family efflux transporter periplasmic adaptor subunit [bacterium]